MTAIRIILVIVGIVAGQFIASSDGWSSEELSKLVEQAKQDENVVFYGVTNPAAMTPILRRFKEKYPFLKVDHYRAGHSALLEKVLAESRAGRYPDVIGNTVFQQIYLADKGFFEPYDPPERKLIRDEFLDPGNRFVAYGFKPFSLVFNTGSVRASELPQSYEGLLDQKWKGRLGFITQDVGWVIGIVNHMGKEKGEKYLKDLSKQDLHLRRGHSLQIQEVAAGAYDIGITSYPDLTSNFKRIGAPVDFAYIRPIFSRFSALGLVKKGKHKAAGKLLMRFLLSKEGQGMYRDSGRMPARRDVKPLDPKLTENVVFTPLKPEWIPLYKPYAEFIQKTFLK